ncbi:MAG: membrane protein insertase YidC [Kiritimatiellae bacterium]|nr:membrane protein insertase YidC [Kiritimatiellia bacterium]
MNKQEITIVVILFVGLLGWGYFQRQEAASRVPAPVPAEAAALDATNAVDQAVAPAIEAPAAAPAAAPAPVAPVVAAAEPVLEPVKHALPEQTLLLTNGVANVTVSSWGGSITRVELKDYPETVDDDSGPVVLDLSGHPALSLTGLPGFSTAHDYELEYASEGNAVLLTCETANGLRLERRLELGEDYRLKLTDTFINRGAAAIALPEYAMAVGPMEAVRTKANTRGQVYLGLDSLADLGGAKVQRWGRKGQGTLKSIPALFGGSSGGCSRNRMPVDHMPQSVEQHIAAPQTWVAAKNKFFVQILAPEEPATACTLYAERDAEAQRFAVSTVSADMKLGTKLIGPGERVARKAAYYVGPKKFKILKTLGQRQDEVMLYAWWQWFRWLCRGLLATLNGIQAVIPGGYGMAIIILTLIVRTLFWPITHKSTQSMKEMQKVQPLVKEIREKYKDKPQKMNQEVMALYKVHKINPMAGCLPILVQMPVFIALFTVLRSAVELRYANFLWIADLSEPEGLFAGAIPFIGSLNFLPLVMAGTMFWQQKLTPSGGDPQQQKMMMFMPFMMLFLFYSMPSALVLYWSVSQGVSIAQMLHSRRLTTKAEARAHA